VSHEVKVSVIMPAYNEEKRIETCFHKVVEALEEYGQSFEIILEQDGSTDRTPEIIQKLADTCPCVKALHFLNRMGKGFGVRKCLEAARGELIVMIDSDMEYPPEGIQYLLNKMDGVDIVVGSRTDWKNYRTKVWRRISSIVYGLLLNVLFGANGLRDPQSGFKVYKRRIIEKITPLTSNGFEIDTEILIKALKKGYRISHLPITYTYKGNSKVDMLKDPLRMFASLLRWRMKGMFKIESETKATVIRHSLQARREVEREAARYDQGRVGYESRNPLVRLFFRRKMEAVLKVTSNRGNTAVLDVGCGDGCLLLKLEGGVKVGMDLSTTRLNRARSRVPDASFVHGDAEHLPFRESSFDLVMCLDVLEHLHNPQRCVRDLESSSREGGIILISIPNERLLSFSRFLTAKYPFSLRGHGHVHSIKPTEVAKFFNGAKLSLIRKIPATLLPITTLIGMKKNATKARQSFFEVSGSLYIQDGAEQR